VADLNRAHPGLVEEGPPLLDAGGGRVGFAAGGPPLFFYHEALPPEPAPPAGGAAPFVRVPYDPREVDAAIVAARAAPPAPLLEGPPAALAAAARGRDRLYALLLAEFAAVLRRDRDAATRRELAAAIRGTHFGQARSVAALRRRLVEVLAPGGGPPPPGAAGDLAAVRDAVARAFSANPLDPAPGALAAIEAASFAFDRRLLARLRALPSAAATAAELRRLLRDSVAEVGAGREGAREGAPNAYVSCGEPTAAPRGQCEGARLALPADLADDFFALLAADVRDPGKASLLAAAAGGVFEPLEFVERPGERLEFGPVEA
jgi:hypothetical protein